MCSYDAVNSRPVLDSVKSSEVGDVDQHTFHCPSSCIDVQPDQAEVQTEEVQSKEPFEESVDEVKSNASAGSRGSAASTLAQFEPSEHAYRAPQRNVWGDMTHEPTDPSFLKPGSAYVPATVLQRRVQQLQPVPEAMPAAQATREEAKRAREKLLRLQQQQFIDDKKAECERKNKEFNDWRLGA